MAVPYPVRQIIYWYFNHLGERDVFLKNGCFFPVCNLCGNFKMASAMGRDLACFEGFSFEHLFLYVADAGGSRDTFSLLYASFFFVILPMW